MKQFLCACFLAIFAGVSAQAQQDTPKQPYIFDGINPISEDVVRFEKTLPDGPIAMLNMIRLKSGVDRSQWMAELSRLNRPFLPQGNSQILYISSGPHDLITGEKWDFIFLIKYEKFADFAEVVTHQDWIKNVAPYRTATIEKAKLVATVPLKAPKK